MNHPNLYLACSAVPAKMIEGTKLEPGKEVKLQVIGEFSYTGNDVIPDGEYMIATKGSGKVKDFIRGLKVGDVVTLRPSAKVDGKEVMPESLATGNPWILRDGNTLDSESDRGDASARHPRSGIGYSGDGSKFVMMVIDGRSGISAGVHTKELADLMHYAGADDAVNVDGGGSSALYTLPLGVRNTPSDGKERAVACGMFLSADIDSSDKDIAEIRFEKWAATLSKFELFTPVIYGYNKSGMLVDTNVEGFELSCDGKIGEIVNGGITFRGTSNGICGLKATYNGLTASIPVTVSENGGIADNAAAASLKMYPNPVESGKTFNVESDGDTEVDVFAATGAKVLGVSGYGNVEVPTSGMNGMYLVRVKCNNRVETSKLFVK